MVGKVAAIAVVVVVLVGATVFGYITLGTSSSSSSSPRSSTPIPAGTQSTFSLTSSDLEITTASLSNDSLSVTIQNTGASAASIESLLLTKGTGCSLNFLANATASVTSSASVSTNRTRPSFTLPACMTGGIIFVVQNNSTLRQVALGNFTRAFNSTFSRSFSTSINFSRTFSGNFSRSFPGNFSAGFPGQFGFFGNSSGLQIPAGQSVTLTYSGTIGSGIASGSEYTIMVTGTQGEASITVLVS